MADTGTTQTTPLESLLESYRPLAVATDELIGAQGSVRPAWHGLLDAFATFPQSELRHRVHRAQQYLQDAGVFFRAYGPDGSEPRDWPLSHVPVILSGEDWRQIEAGVIQRADLLEAVAADLYGPARLVSEGHLPAALVARMQEWLRPMVGIQPRSGHFLHFLAFEIGRGPDGKWWVLGDRTQAPSGAGFAIENRIAMSRMLPEFFGAGQIARLGGFFQDFRRSLERMCGPFGGRIGVLTPGQLNDGYFEHAYIARYLGFILLEGDDIIVRGNRVMVRTVEGLQPIDVIWRRLDALYSDPVELIETSRLGTPGLVGVLRRQGVSLVNALGSGVLETRAMLAFLPRICEAVLGEPLKIPNIATWWCGQPTEREHVKDNVERMMIGPALATRLPFDADEATVLGSRFREGARSSVVDWIDRDATDLVGQETVRLSTTPALHQGQLVPRPMSVRVFVARTDRGWQVMPGGYARIGRSEDATALSLQRGGSVADVWVLDDGRVGGGPSIMELRRERLTRAESNGLPSRSADNLYWLGRYVERAEGLMRLTRAYHLRLSEADDPDTPLLGQLKESLANLGVDVAQPMPEGLTASIDSAVQSASQVRDRFSQDGWVALTDLQSSASGLSETLDTEHDISRAIGNLLRQVTGFSGLVQDNMYRFTGWRFLSFGRAMERALGTCRVLAEFVGPDMPLGALDLVIEYGDSGMTHRRRYSMTTSRHSVLDLIALDSRNPRSVRFQLDRLEMLGEQLPGAEDHGQLSDFMRAVVRTKTDIELQRAETLDADALWATRAALQGISNLLTEAYLR